MRAARQQLHGVVFEHLIFRILHPSQALLTLFLPRGGASGGSCDMVHGGEDMWTELDVY